MTDEELVALARTGSNEAFAELMRRNSGATRKLAASVLRSIDEAEDALQDAWSKAWQHVASFHGDSKFSTWFTRIVLNQCLMRIRSRKRKPVVSLEEESPAAQIADERAGPEETCSRRQLRDMVRKEVSLMPPQFRDPIVLRDFNQLSVEAVASRLKVSIPAAKSRILRARAELRRRLERLTCESLPV